MTDTASAEALSTTDRTVLDLEGRQWSTSGGKLAAIMATGLSETAHAQRLNRLLDEPAALAYAPMVVSRLRPVRAARRR